MSRAERRQYQRMTKGQDPYAPPSRGAGRPPRRPRSTAPRSWEFSRGFWLRSVGLGFVVGLVGFSAAWSSGGERALLIGLAAGVAAVALLAGLRYLLRRRAGAR